MFFAFVPLLLIENHYFRKKKSALGLFGYVYLSFFIWNVLTTWWIWNSTPVALVAWALNSLFMAIVVILYHYTRKKIYQRNRGHVIFIIYWTGFEFLHLNWELSWSWLNIGNGFASYYKWIQWYEHTGILGGTLWVLIINVLIFKLFIMSMNEMKKYWRFVIQFGLVILLIFGPILLSFRTYMNFEEDGETINAIVVQPNLDPYSEQYSVPPLQVVDMNLNLALSKLENEVAFIVCPESTIQESIWESQLEASPSLNSIQQFVDKNPNSRIVIGSSTFRRLAEGEDKTYAARYHEGGDFWYYAYNTALYIDTSRLVQIHHKSMLTLGVEKMPSWRILAPVRNLAIDLGGTVGTLGADEEQIPFHSGDSVRIAPLICYESVFGEFTTEFVKNGANVIFIITNDGWWGNTPGHRQHLTFASLRAIECRRSIARSANTGISAFIDQKGDIHQKTEYWEPDVIKESLALNNRVTFYAQHGDYIGRVAAFLSIVYMLLAISFFLGRKNFILAR